MANPLAPPIVIAISPDAAGRMLSRVQGLATQFSDMKPLGLAISKVLRASFAKNIDVGGRPAFVPLSPNTLASKKLLGYPSTPLVRTGLLRNSLARRNSKGNVTYVTADGEVRVGTNIPYARYMNDGTAPHLITAKAGKMLAFTTAKGKVVVKSVRHPGTPPRPFLIVQAEDWVEIKRLMKLFAAGTLPANAGDD